MYFESSDQEMYITAVTVWREARGEPIAGKVAVAQVIRNRVNDSQSRWPSTPSSVCRQHLQFSSWNVGDPNASLWPSPGDQSWSDSCEAVQQVFADNIPDPTGGANAYHAYSYGHPRFPAWAEGISPTAVIGHHTFYRL